MSNQELHPLSAFEWASVTHYIVYISSVAGLEEVSSERVVSFPMARIGPESLIVRKENTLKLLERNISRLEKFAASKKEELGPYELSVLRSLYIQYRNNVNTVRDHLRTAKIYIDAEQAGLFPVREDYDDEELF